MSKGSKRRPGDDEKFRDEWERIFKKELPESSKVIFSPIDWLFCSVLGHEYEGGCCIFCGTPEK